METQDFNLTLLTDDRPPNIPTVYCNQYDEGRVYTATIYDVDGNLYTFDGTETVTVRGTRPDGEGFSYYATASGNTVSFTLTDVMSDVKGYVRCGIVIVVGTATVGTLVFRLYVQPAALEADTIIGSSTFEGVITAAVEEAVAAALTDTNPVLVVNISSITSLPYTVENAAITADAVCLRMTLGTPSAQLSDWTFTTSEGSLTISGTLSGTTSAVLYMVDTTTPMETVEVDFSAISSLPVTSSYNAAITADMVCVGYTVGTPSAQLSDWTITTTAGYVTVSGTVSGTTTLVLYLAKGRTITG